MLAFFPNDVLKIAYYLVLVWNELPMLSVSFGFIIYYNANPETNHNPTTAQTPQTKKTNTNTNTNPSL